MARKPRLLFVTIQSQSFVVQDLEALHQHYDVRTFRFGVRRGLRHLLRQAVFFVWLLRQIWRTRYVYIWFCDYHALLPAMLGRLLAKKVLIVIGGFDAVKVPDLNYGAHVSPLRSAVIRMSCRLATMLLPVSQVSLNYLRASVGPFVSKKSQVVYNGVDVDRFSEGATPKSNKVICIGIIADERTYRVKGIDRFVEVAQAIPEARFVLVGLSGRAADLAAAPDLPNLEILAPVEHSALNAHLQTARVICQFSRMESFGLALAEGMLARCVPVSIAELGTAEVMGDTGVLIDQYSLENAVKAVRSALTSDPQAGEAARRRVRTQFSLEQRSARILSILRTL
ncbi:MAG: glycosyltransferase family 4 protein [Saprospiraceae bacterium]|nr:glycosyltransferase family 4 protein [Saprospiraceae bacterium]